MGLAPELDEFIKERVMLIRDMLTDKIEQDIIKSYQEFLVHGNCLDKERQNVIIPEFSIRS